MSKEAEVLLAKLTVMGIPAHQLTSPHDSMVMTECDVRIRRVSDGKEVLYKDDLIWSDDYEEPQLCTFIWEEGNFSCDCNRESFFYDAMNIPRDKQPDNGCNTGENEFQVEIKDWTGKVIYSDISPDL